MSKQALNQQFIQSESQLHKLLKQKTKGSYPNHTDSQQLHSTDGNLMTFTNRNHHQAKQSQIIAQTVLSRNLSGLKPGNQKLSQTHSVPHINAKSPKLTDHEAISHIHNSRLQPLTPRETLPELMTTDQERPSMTQGQNTPSKNSSRAILSLNSLLGASYIPNRKQSIFDQKPQINTLFEVQSEDAYYNQQSDHGYEFMSPLNLGANLEQTVVMDVRSPLTVTSVNQTTIPMQPEEQFLDRPLDPCLQEFDSQRGSIKMSFLSSDSALVRLERKLMQDMESKATWVMNRMQWLTRLQVLFSSLETFIGLRAAHVEKKNFIDGLENIKPILPLEDPQEYSDKSTQVSLSYQFVLQQLEQHLPEFFTWDNLFDVLLYQSIASQFTVGESLSGTIVSVQLQPKEDLPTTPIIEKVTVLDNPVLQKNHEDQQELRVRWSEGSSDDGQIESNSERSKKSIEGNYKFSFAANVQQHNQLSQKMGTQIRSKRHSSHRQSIAATEIDHVESEKESDGFVESKTAISSKKLAQPQLPLQKPNAPSNQGTPEYPGSPEKAESSQALSKGIKQSQHILGQQSPTHRQTAAFNSIATKDIEQRNQTQPLSKDNKIIPPQTSEELSYQIQKEPGFNFVTPSTQSPLNKSVNTEKERQESASKKVIPFNQKMEQSSIIAVNLSKNNLFKTPSNIYRNIIILDISQNRLKSLAGVENCTQLQYLNASKNQISSILAVNKLPKLRELFLKHNQLSSIFLKEVIQNRNLQILDVSCNKLSDWDKFSAHSGQPGQKFAGLKVIDLSQNQMRKQTKGLNQKLLKLFPSLAIIDPVDGALLISQFREQTQSQQFINQMSFDLMSQIEPIKSVTKQSRNPLSIAKKSPKQMLEQYKRQHNFKPVSQLRQTEHEVRPSQTPKAQSGKQLIFKRDSSVKSVSSRHKFSRAATVKNLTGKANTRLAQINTSTAFIEQVAQDCKNRLLSENLKLQMAQGLASKASPKNSKR